jgi:hypothetical protein
MTTVVRCPRTGRACSEGAGRERHWCRQLFERGLSHRGLPLKRQIPTEVLRQDQSRSSVHHEGCGRESGAAGSTAGCLPGLKRRPVAPG